MYSVGINGKYTNDGKATKEFFESKGCVVNPSRLFGDYDVFSDGKRIAVIFNSQQDQINHLKEKGVLN